MDVLSEVLRGIRLTGVIFFDARFHAPWVGQAPDSAAIARSVMPEAEHVISFHAVISGSCWTELISHSHPAIELAAGDVVIYPKGDANVMASAPGLRANPDLALYDRSRHPMLPVQLQNGGAGEECHFVCGFLGCDARPFNPLLEALPRMLHGRSSADGKGWVAQLIRLALEESETGRAGGDTLRARACELMFVDVVRDYLEGLPPGAQGWLAGLRDPHVGAALRLIHARPTDDWTLEKLAHAVGMSRSTFAERFALHLGVGPIHYLGRWRMQLAARLLEQPGYSLARAGAEIGYESEAAFNRAFKKFVGTTPGAWRKARLAAAEGRDEGSVTLAGEAPAG